MSRYFDQEVGRQASTYDNSPHPGTPTFGLNRNSLCTFQYPQGWRPRRRTVFILAFITLIASSLIFFKELGSSRFKNSQRWDPTASPHDLYLGANSTKAPETTTINAPMTEKTTTYHHHHHSIAPKLDAVVFFLIIWSESSAAEGAILIKSILLYNTSPSEIHIICDDSAQRFLQARLSLVKRPLQDIRVYFYKPTWESMLDRVEREGSIKTDHSAGLPGLMKLFIHEILPPVVKKGIYIDTDAFFISDPTLLWNVFEHLKSSTAIVMSSHPDQDTPEWHHASRICSCIMLLDLEKLRGLRMMDSSIYREDRSGKHPPALSPPAFKAKYGLPGKDGHGHYDNVRLGDQGYWWAIVDHRPDLFEPLSYDFEVTSCLLDTYMTGLGDDSISESEEMSKQIFTKNTLQEGRVVLPKLLHFNCLHGTSIYMNWEGWSDPGNSLSARWGAAVAYHVGYKWIWLNQGHDLAHTGTLRMQTFTNLLFSDEESIQIPQAKY